MCAVGDDFVTMLHSDDRRARKDHRCGECGRTIAKGEMYRAETFVWEGDLDGSKVCAHCMNVRRWLVEACSGWIYGELGSDLAEHVTGDEREMRTRPLTRLLRWMQADWRNRAGDLRSVEDVTLVTDEAIAAFKAMVAA